MRRQIGFVRLGGYSLMELLIALALSLFLISGVAVVYASLSQSYHVEQQTAQLRQRERLLTNFVGAVVRSAGYYAAPMTNYPALAFPADSTFVVTGQSIRGRSSERNGRPADSLTVRFLTAPGDGVLNCLGYGNTGTVSGDYRLYVNQFRLDSRHRQLECRLSGPGMATRTQPLLDGVMSLQVRYGVDSDHDGSADRYLAASAMTAWSAVRSVTMTVLFAPDGNPVTGVPDRTAAPIPFRVVFPIRSRSIGFEENNRE